MKDKGDECDICTGVLERADDIARRCGGPEELRAGGASEEGTYAAEVGAEAARNDACGDDSTKFEQVVQPAAGGAAA